MTAPTETPDPISSEDEAPAEPQHPDSQWYVIHTYSGYENKVKKNLDHRIDSMGMKDKIFEVVVPSETTIEMKNGKREPIVKKLFPGYVLVNMIELKERDEASNEAWFVVR